MGGGERLVVAAAFFSGVEDDVAAQVEVVGAQEGIADGGVAEEVGVVADEDEAATALDPLPDALPFFQGEGLGGGDYPEFVVVVKLVEGVEFLGADEAVEEVVGVLGGNGKGIVVLQGVAPLAVLEDGALGFSAESVVDLVDPKGAQAEFAGEDEGEELQAACAVRFARELPGAEDGGAEGGGQQALGGIQRAAAEQKEAAEQEGEACGDEAAGGQLCAQGADAAKEEDGGCGVAVGFIDGGVDAAPEDAEECDEGEEDSGGHRSSGVSRQGEPVAMMRMPSTCALPLASGSSGMLRASAMPFCGPRGMAPAL